MNITSVIVTYNRKDCLEKLLNIYENLTYKPTNVIIVNNNSNDGTDELLNKWSVQKSIYSKYLINMPKNVGGSGGFCEGIKKALEINSDWIYVSDDDAYPNKDVLEIFNQYINEKDTKNIAAICGKVINNGEIALGARRRIKKGILLIKEKCVEEKEYNNFFELDLFTYVGTMLNAKYIKKYGLPERDYFIYYDDTEHSLRLSKHGDIICLPKAKIYHDISSKTKDSNNWKIYYLIRNKLLMIKKHYGLRYFIIEYILYILRIIKRIFKGEIEVAKIYKKGVKDARKNIKGMDNLYKPGWTNNN